MEYERLVRFENPSNWVQAYCSQPVPTQLGFNINKGGYDHNQFCNQSWSQFRELW